MHILYLDDSGSASNKNERYLVLGGISVYEAQSSYFTRELDNLAQSVSPGEPHSVEFHASEIFSGRRAPWDRMSKDDRRGVIKAVLRIAADAYESARLFACAVDKASFPAEDPMEIAFEDICSRFDLYLKRLQASGDRDRGLIILDKSSYEATLQRRARGFRVDGTRWRRINTLVDTPVFVDSAASRLVQTADAIAYSVFRRYEAGDSSYFDIIAARFDTADGRVHGLSHRQSNDSSCMCPACLSRRLSPPKA